MTLPEDSGPGVFVAKAAQLVVQRGLQGVGQLIEWHEMVCLRVSQDGMFRVRVPDQRQQVVRRQVVHPLRDVFGVILR